MFEALSSGGATEFPLVEPQLTLIQDYRLPLERYYGDYEDDEGELRAESNLAEKFGEPPPHPEVSPARYHEVEAVSDYQSLTPGGRWGWGGGAAPVPGFCVLAANRSLKQEFA